MNDDHLHIELPSGAMASISKDCPPETLAALDKMAEAAKRAVIDGTIRDEAEGGSGSASCSSPEYPCTECGGDAFIGMSGWSEADGSVMIGKKERLCLPCARNRGVENPFQTNKNDRSSRSD